MRFESPVLTYKSRINERDHRTVDSCWGFKRGPDTFECLLCGRGLRQYYGPSDIKSTDAIKLIVTDRRPRDCSQVWQVRADQIAIYRALHMRISFACPKWFGLNHTPDFNGWVAKPKPIALWWWIEIV